MDGPTVPTTESIYQKGNLMLVAICQPVEGNDRVLPPGTVVDWQPDGEAKRLVRIGVVQPATEQEIAEAGHVRTVRTRIHCH